MSQEHTCNTCYHYSHGSCPHNLRPEGNDCPSYAIDGPLWAELRKTLCPTCEFYDKDGFCNIIGFFSEETPSTECVAYSRHKRLHGDAVSIREELPAAMHHSPREAAYPQAFPAPRPAAPLMEETTPISRDAELRQAERRTQSASSGKSASMKPTPVQETPRQKRPFSLYLYFLNPFAILGVLIIFVAFGFCFHVTPWNPEMWQTGVCTLAAMLLISFVFGLIWGVMNPQCRPARFLLAGCLGAAAAIALWQTDTFLQLLIAIGGSFAVMCVCFFLAWLGTLATNSLFKVKERFARRFAQPGA